MAILSSLPVFSEQIPDASGTIFRLGQMGRVVQVVGAVSFGAAESAERVAGAAVRSVEVAGTTAAAVGAAASTAAATAATAAVAAVEHRLTRQGSCHLGAQPSGSSSNGET